MSKVDIDDPGSLNILGLMLRDNIEKNLTRPDRAGKIKNLNLNLCIKASLMETTLKFQEGRVSISNGRADKPDVSITGSITDLLSVVLGNNRVLPILARRIRIKGSLKRLIPVLLFLRP